MKAKAGAESKPPKPSPAEIARRVSGLHAAHRERKAAQAVEDEHKAWFKERAQMGPLWRIGLMVVELVTKPRTSLDKEKVAKALGGADTKKFQACMKTTLVTECQVYEEGEAKAQ